MKNKQALCRLLLVLATLMFSVGKVSATHLYGADFFYTHVTGNTYNISLVVYGDCAGGAFPSLSSAAPEVDIENGTTPFATINLTLQAPTAGVEVTPVCPSQLSNTNCKNPPGSIPGVTKFVYTGSITLNATSANWRFIFTGTLNPPPSGTSAGRSTTLTNITGTGTTITALEATLNNLAGPNSSPTYTTIPTPFFCINKPANYNPGTVDPNSDVLSYALVPGFNLPSGTVTYISPYTATAPLATATGTFNFNTTNGQMTFTPNLAQRSLVVNKVSEFRGNTLVGTSMREMTFVVLNTCSNNPPVGKIGNPSNGTVVDSITFKACRSSGTVAFSINPTDPDLDIINVSASGIPSGATFNIGNNNTSSPTGAFSWNISAVPAGTYTFFITYTDNGCPLSSKQTMAYTINVLPEPDVTFTLVSAATCTKKAVFDLTPSGTPNPWRIDISQSSILHTFTNLTGVQRDSLAPGTYNVRVTNANTCFKNISITLAQPPPVFATVNSIVTPKCNAGTDGSITITGSGGLPPFSYAIGTGTYSSTNTFTGLTAGTYVLHIKDANDCIKDTVLVITQPQSITASIFPKKPTCNAYTNGEISITATDGTPPYRFALGTGVYSAINTFTGLAAGTYALHVKDANDCVRDINFTLVDSLTVHAPATVTNLLCNGDNTGAITFAPFGGASPYQFKNGTAPFTSGNTFSGLASGTYNFRIQDVLNCFLDTPVNVSQPPVLSSTSAVTNVRCFGQANGSITTTGTGGTTPYTYALGTGTFSSTNTFSSLPIGTYTIHVKDANNCLKDTIINITQPPVLAISNVTPTMPTCFGYSNGTFTITATGGVTPYNYAVDANPFGSSNVLTGLAAGTYTIHLKDANNCTADVTGTITQPTPIIPSATVKNSTCNPVNNGSVTLGATGGIPAYQFAVGSGVYSSSPTFNSVAGGTYTFHIKDNLGCIKDTVLTILDSFVIRATLTVTNVKCYNGSDGTITITANGGLSPYTYAANSGSYSSSNVLTNLPLGAHTVHVRDNRGCGKDTTPVNIGQPAPISPSVAVVIPTCHGSSDGKVSLAASGGIPSYTFAMGSGAYSSTAVFNGLTAGSYVFHIKDANNCLRDTVVTLKDPEVLDFRISTSNVLCAGGKTGSVTVTGTGGISPYTYSVNFGAFQANNIIGNLAAGSQYIRLKDNNGCIKDSTVVLFEPARLYIDSLKITTPTCEGFVDGSVTVHAKGGISPYTYGTSSPATGTSNVFPSLAEGTYTFFIKDNNGCESDTTISLKGYPPIIIQSIITDSVSCFGYADGSLTILATGGMQPFKYKVNNGVFQDNSVVNNLPAGVYKIVVSDSKDCKKEGSAVIDAPEVLKVTLLTTPNDCRGYDNGGRIDANVTGGTEPYTYVWNNENASSVLNGIPNGKYWVQVSDNNACRDSATAEVAYDNCCNMFIPDVFSPNGDGLNDIIRIRFKGDFALKTFAIFNRFGQQVFSTSDITQGWNGIFKGEPQDIGTFNYFVTGVCGNSGNRPSMYKGTITLIR